MDCRIPSDLAALLHDVLQSILLMCAPQFPQVMVKKHWLVNTEMR